MPAFTFLGGGLLPAPAMRSPPIMPDVSMPEPEASSSIPSVSSAGPPRPSSTLHSATAHLNLLDAAWEAR